MMLTKLLALGATSLLGLALSVAVTAGPGDEPPPPPKAKKKDDHRPGGDLRKAYDLLRRLRADGRTTGRPEERLKDWTDRATRIYRDAVKASEAGENREAHELGAAAHDLARAVDHARNAAASEPDDDLPPPPEDRGEGERTLRDLRHAHDRVVDLRDADGPDAKFYFGASRDLYNAARRDAQAGRRERAGELARAAEALTHVPEHLAHATRDPEPPKAKRDRPEPPKEKEKEKAKEKEKEKEKRDRPDHGGEIPPPID